MKCIQVIKETKNYEVGHIKRVDDVDAESKVKSGFWKYVPKSEYKKVKEVTEYKNWVETEPKKEKPKTKKKRGK